MKAIGKHLKKTFVTGIFIVIPIGITIFILKFLFNFADGILGSHLDKLLVYYGRTEGHIPGIGMITGALVIYLTGLVAANVFGKRLLKWGDDLLTRIPLVKSIYTSSKQLTKVFKEGPRTGVRSSWSGPGPAFVQWVL